MVNLKINILKFLSVFLFILVPASRFCLLQIASAQSETLQGGPVMTMKLISSAFLHNQEIPQRYTCDGNDVSPPLKWSGIPAGCKSLALVVSDPDAPDPAAPRMTWIHWVLYNLPPDSGSLEDSVASSGLPVSTLEGKNDWKRTGYSGPCPPIGRHRYYFTLYALDAILPDLGKPTRSVLEKAMKGHVLEEAMLMGTYQR